MKKSYLVIIVVLLLLVITNPSQKAFKEYLGVSSYSGLRRTSNYFICSVFVSDDKYFAILGNFFEINTDPFTKYGGHEIEPKRTDNSMVDSAKMTDTSYKMMDTSIQYDEYGIPKKKVSITIMPYKYRVYNALKNNANEFTLTKEEFYNKLQSKNYQLYIYHLLKEKITGFTKSQDDFIKAINSN